MNKEVVIFTDIASVHLSLDSVIYGLIITFLAGCVIGFMFYKFTKNDRYIYSKANHAPLIKKGPPKTQKKEDTQKYPTKIPRSS